MGRRYERAEYLAGEFRAAIAGDPAERPVVVDVADALGNAPCVMFTPPRSGAGRLDSGAVDIEWRVVILSSGPPTFSSWQELDDLVELVEREFPVTSVEPGVYPLVAGQEPHACYVVTIPDTL